MFTWPNKPTIQTQHDSSVPGSCPWLSWSCPMSQTSWLVSDIVKMCPTCAVHVSRTRHGHDPRFGVFVLHRQKDILVKEYNFSFVGIEISANLIINNYFLESYCILWIVLFEFGVLVLLVRITCIFVCSFYCIYTEALPLNFEKGRLWCWRLPHPFGC